MRHKISHRKLNKPTDQLMALLKNQVQALFTHERIVTTEARAKEVRSLAEKLIARAKVAPRYAGRAFSETRPSNFGDEVNFCAPGVAITSTVPIDGFSAWDGTSMACPQVTGIAALALAMNSIVVQRYTRRQRRLNPHRETATASWRFGADCCFTRCIHKISH